MSNNHNMTDNINNIPTTQITPEFAADSSNENLQGKDPVMSRIPRPLFGHSFGIFDYIVFAAVSAGIIANQFVSAGWLRWIIIGGCLAALAVPAVIQKIKVRNQFNLWTIFRLFKKMGLNPSLEGDSVAWILGA